MNNAPVGVFDSGVGGLSVLREIQTHLPDEKLLYVADSAHVPYGEKSQDYIRARSRSIADFLLGQGVKALVLACNTATAAAVAELRERHPGLPIVGMEPAVKPAVAATRNGVIGVLATSGTLASAKFAALLDRFSHDVKVITQPCPGLMECVERGDLQGPQVRALLAGYLAPLRAAGCDTVILGCTHYPFLRPLLSELLPGVRLVDTGEAVARQLQRLLAEADLLATGPGSARFYSSAEPAALAALLPVLWGNAGSVNLLPEL